MSAAARIMKFVVEKSGASGCRVGLLEFTGCNSGAYETPMFFAHTDAGSIPHITNEVYNMIFNASDTSNPQPPLQISLDSMIYTAEHMVKAGKKLNVSEFVGYRGTPTLMTVLNPSKDIISGYNDRNGIAVWWRNGKRKVDFEMFKRVTEALSPCVYQALSDYDISSESTDKRLKKATTRVVDYLEKTVEFAKEEGSGRILCALEPAWFLVNEQEGERTLAKVLELRDHLAGFLVKRNSEDDIDFVKQVGILNKKLPEDKIRYVSGVLEPGEIVESVLNGVDVFDSSLCTVMTEAKQVMLLPAKLLEMVEPGHPQEDLPVHGESNGVAKRNEEDRSKLVVLDLKDKRYFDDFQPVDPLCTCHTCRSHTRSYVHHLHATNELLGSVLIMMHNLHTFNMLFRILRTCLKNDIDLATEVRDTLIPFPVTLQNGTEREETQQAVAS